MTVADYLLEESRSLNKEVIVGTKEIMYYKELCEQVNLLSAHLNSKYGKGKEILLFSDVRYQQPFEMLFLLLQSHC